MTDITLTRNLFFNLIPILEIITFLINQMQYKDINKYSKYTIVRNLLNRSTFVYKQTYVDKQLHEIHIE